MVYPRGFKRSRTTGRVAVVFSPLQALQAGAPTELCGAAQGHHAAVSLEVHYIFGALPGAEHCPCYQRRHSPVSLVRGTFSLPISSACFHHALPNSSLLSSSCLGQPSITPTVCLGSRSHFTSGPWGGEALVPWRGRGGRPCRRTPGMMLTKANFLNTPCARLCPNSYTNIPLQSSQ